jgi:hypothetical protein
MARVPFFVPPLSEELQRRTLVAHVARGFCFHITSLPTAPRPNSQLALPLTLNLLPRLPEFVHIDKHVPLLSYHVFALLNHVSKHWRRQLCELDLAFTHLLFMQLKTEEVPIALDQIHITLEFCNGGGAAEPLTWRAMTMKTSEAIPKDILQKLEMSLASLEQTLTNKDPMMPQHLRNTHSILISYPETVHLLDDAEIARIIDAAEVHTKTEVVKAIATKKAGGGKAKVSVDDL